jgi:hypothetical protein
VYAGKEGWTTGARLPVTAAGGAPVLEDGTLLRLGGYVRTAGGKWQTLAPVPPSFAGLPEQPLAATFGGTLALQSAAHSAAAGIGEDLLLRLRWERLGAAPPNLSRFVHVLNAAGETVAQMDGPVTDAFGPLPVDGWPPGTPVDDVLTIPLPADLAPGPYTLAAGLYDWQTGERLAAAGSAARPDGAAELGTIEIAE